MKRRGLHIRARVARWATVATAAVALGGGVPVATSASAAQSPTAVAARCTYGKINGHRKCLKRGEYCSRSAEKQYEKYGFTCSKRDRRGRWHLQ